jgi:hypothetical protein
MSKEATPIGMGLVSLTAVLLAFVAGVLVTKFGVADNIAVLVAIVACTGVSLLYILFRIGVNSVKEHADIPTDTQPGVSAKPQVVQTNPKGHHHQEVSSKNDATSTQEFSDTFSTSWSRRLDELKEFKARVGHVDVPLDSASRTAETPKGLGNWVYKQRKLKENNKLKAEQVAALDELGFRWQFGCDELDWNEMISRLNAYKEAEGDTLVPKKYEADPILGAWVCETRRKADKVRRAVCTCL